MKKTFSISAFLVCTIIILSFFPVYLHSQWVKANGPYGGNINCIASSASNIFAGILGGGVFLSSNKGVNWSDVNNGLTDLNVDALAVSGSNIFGLRNQTI